MKHDGIVFDFNGTLLDDVELGIRAINTLLLRSGKKPITSAEEYRRVFGFPVKDYYTRVGLDPNRFETYAVEWVEEYNRGEPMTKLFDGVVELLDWLKGNGYHLYLLSATERAMLHRQLDRLCIENVFDEIIGQDDIHAHGKLESAVEWSKKVKCKNLLFIGDSRHDAEVARAVGADCILLSCGHEEKGVLLKTGNRVYADACDLLYQFRSGEIE